VFSVTLLCSGFLRWTFLCSRAHVLGRPAAISQQHPTTATAVSGLSLDSTRNGSWSSSNSTGKDHKENTAYNSHSILVYVSAAATTWRLMGRCVATDVSAEPFLINSCLCWLHNSGFQQTCHKTYTDLLLKYRYNMVNIFQNCACTYIIVVRIVTILVYLKAFKTSRCVRQNKFKLGRVEARDSK
jgi:hypothetical protein